MRRELPGFRRDRLVEQRDVRGTFQIVTLVEWEDVRAMASAKEAVAARYREAGFDPQAFLARLGIEANFGTYAEIARTETKNEPSGFTKP